MLFLCPDTAKIAAHITKPLTKKYDPRDNAVELTPPEWDFDGLVAPVPLGCGRDADEGVQGEHHDEHNRAPPPEWDLDGLEAPVPLGAVGMSMKMFGKVRKLKYRTCNNLNSPILAIPHRAA